MNKPEVQIAAPVKAEITNKIVDVRISGIAPQTPPGFMLPVSIANVGTSSVPVHIVQAEKNWPIPVNVRQAKEDQAIRVQISQAKEDQAIRVETSSMIPSFVEEGKKYDITLAAHQGTAKSGIFTVDAVYSTGWVKVSRTSSPSFAGYINLAQVVTIVDG